MMHKSKKSVLHFALCIAVLFLAGASGASSKGWRSSLSVKQTANAVKSLMRLRSPSAVIPTYWSYSGMLRSAEDGSVIADIHGLECCKTLSSGRFDPKNSGATRNLLAHKHLQQGDEFHSVMSRKSFVFTEHGTDVPLRTWASRWTKRKVSPSMRMDQIITVASKQNDTVLFHIQWPGNHEMFSHQLSVNQRQGWWSRLLSITSYVHPQQSQRMKGNKWIAFGPPPPPRDGSLEYYNYAITPWSTEGQVRRFGESPPWYGIQKKTSTELRFHRHASLRTVPKSTLELVKQCDPGFFDMPESSADFAKLSDPRTRYFPWWKRFGNWMTSRADMYRDHSSFA